MTTDLSIRDQRVIVKYLFKKKCDPTEIHKQLSGVCGEGTVTYKVIREWITDFQEGREDLMDQCQRCVGIGVTNGNSSPTDPAIVARLEMLLNSDRRVTVDQAAEMVSVTKHTAQMIITNVLGLKRVCERWVPRLLTPEQRQHRIATCQELLDRHEAEGDDFLSKIVAGDETFVCYYLPERRPSVTYKYPGPEKNKIIQSQFRVLFAVFYDMQGLLLAHPVPDQTNMTAEYYTYILRDLLLPIIKKKRQGPNGKDKEIILLHDSTSMHSSRLTQATLRDLKIESLPQPPDSPDLLPAEYWLYPHLREQIKSSTFKDRSSTWSAIQHHTNSFAENEMAESIRRLPERWNKVIDFSGGLHML